MADLIPLMLVTVLSMIVATGIIVLVFVYQKKQLQYLNEKEQLKANFDKEILESKLEIQERTMKIISQEIHDNIGQVLSVVKLNINLMHWHDNPYEMQEKINTTASLVGKAIQDLRDLSKSLDSDNITEKGLVRSIEFEFELLKKTGLFSTSLQVEGEPYSLPDHKELILFRIFQEVTNNILKHAQASFVTVYIHFYPHKFELTILDNGKGFDTSLFDQHAGLGLRNMQNRSQLIGAQYHIHSQPGHGTRINIEMPVPAAQTVAASLFQMQ